MVFDLKAIIFDFNGVIANDEPLHLELFRRVMAEEGFHLTDEDYHQKYLGFDDRRCFVAALTDAGKTGADDSAYIDRLIKRKADYYFEAIEERFLLFPGVVDLAQRLAARYPMAITSGALKEEIEFVLQRGGIRDCFQLIVAAEDVQACKPDPEGYLKTLAMLNAANQMEIKSAECLVIEDSMAGVEAAKRAGMRCLAVTNTYRADQLAGADWIVESLVNFDPLLTREKERLRNRRK